MRVAAWTWLAVMALGGCGQQPMPAKGSPAAKPPTKPTVTIVNKPPTRPTIDDCLGDKHLRLCTRRAAVAKCGASSVSAVNIDRADAACTTSRAIDDEVVVVEERGELVRVITRYASVRYALYVRRADLAKRVTARATLVPGVAVLPGAKTVITKRRADAVHITSDEDGITIQGWIPRAKLGAVYTRAPDVAWDDTLKIMAKTAVLDRVGGTMIATIRPGDHYIRLGRIVGTPSATHAQIELVSRAAHIKGYVSATAVKKTEPMGRMKGVGGMSSWTASHTRFVKVPAKTRLHTAPDGPPFARTTTQNGVLALTAKRRDDWLRVRIKTHWHMVFGWVHCPAVRGRYTRVRCTTLDDPRRIKLPN